MRKLLMAILVLCAAGQALGQTPIGSPAATLKQGQFAAGFGYGHSKADVEGTVLGVNVTVEDIEVDTYMANLIFGIAEDLELQIDLGTSSYDDVDFSSSGDFALGFVLRSTFAQHDKVKWGVASSFHWHEAGASGMDVNMPWTEEVSWSEIKIALGPSYTEDRWCLYGGAFMAFVDGKGEYNVGGFRFTGEFEEKDNVGGFVGARIEIVENTELGFEYQMTGSAEVFGASIRFLF